MPEKTLGEARVRTDFNVAGSGYVDEVKQAGAKLIDLINEAANKKEWDDAKLGEWKRLKALAMTDIENGTMWAVKAATL